MAPTEEKKEEEAPEDPPIVVELKKVDDQYLELQKAYEQELEALRRQFKERQKPLLEERNAVLSNPPPGQEDSVTGTPALKGFWCKALKNHPAFEDEIEGYDEPVMEYLRDVESVDLDPEDSKKGFRLRFHFVENPYFTNSVLSKEYLVGETNPYNEEIDLTEIRGCTIDWKEGKDVTVEKVSKQKGGTKKKKGSAKASVEPRPSFFRSFFRSVKEGHLPEDVDPNEIAMAMDADDDADEEDLVDFLMENDYEQGMALRENVLPFAVRWYTGEAAPDDDGDFDEDAEEEDDDDDDEEDEDDVEEVEAPKGKAGKKKAGNQKTEKTAEECKQQ